MRRRLLFTGALVLSLSLLAGCGGAPKANVVDGPGAPALGGGHQAANAVAGADGAAQGQDAALASAEVVGDRYQVVPGESTASYSVQEKFLDRNLDVVAVGTTSNITGELILDKGLFQSSTVVVDLQSLKSDQPRRDQKLRTTALETDKYPTAEFRVTGIAGAAPALADGQEVAFKLEGIMNLHGVEKPWTWDAKGVVEGDTLKLTATTKFNMAEFNIDPPNVLNLISVDDQVQLDVSLVARKQ